MLHIDSEEDIKFLREGISLEFKSGVGKDGRGELPKDFWPTYSAFANTDGGTVLLGIKETSFGFEILGIKDVEKVRKDLFNNLNNRQKVSVNLLTDHSVSEHSIDGKTILKIDIPRASRSQRPVYITENPFGNHSFKRLNEGDIALQDSEVKRLIAEQVEDSRDNRILKGFGWSDLSAESFAAYRHVFSSREPSHPFNELNDNDFLRMIGGWKRNREENFEGLTVAALLMFGRYQAIQDEFPNYMLDYQERPEAKTENRWVDRVTLDGKWSGNLYDFYRRVYLKLTADLKVPFSLRGAERQDETPVHIALREALANTLVHADFTDRASILVVKRPDMFGFRNPGLMRVPLDLALKGGESDCRNRTLHHMFRLVGVGEQAGSGVPKIFQGWETQHWNPPKLHEKSDPNDQTLLELRMIDLFPDDAVELLRGLFGSDFDQLAQEKRVALALAASEGTVNHSRLCTFSTEHPHDNSRVLHGLVQDGFLRASGTGRGVVYYLPGQDKPSPEDIFPNASNSLMSGADGSYVRSNPLNVRSSISIKGQEGDSTGAIRRSDGYLSTAELPLPIIDNLDALSGEIRDRLEAHAAQPRNQKRVNKAVMEEVVLKVCENHYITLQAIASLVDRSPDAFRNQYLSPMVKEQRLSLAFPHTPTHERQAYCTTSSLPLDE